MGRGPCFRQQQCSRNASTPFCPQPPLCSGQIILSLGGPSASCLPMASNSAMPAACMVYHQSSLGLWKHGGSPSSPPDAEGTCALPLRDVLDHEMQGAAPCCSVADRCEELSFRGMRWVCQTLCSTRTLLSLGRAGQVAAPPCLPSSNFCCAVIDRMALSKGVAGRPGARPF